MWVGNPGNGVARNPPGKRAAKALGVGGALLAHGATAGVVFDVACAISC